MMAPVYRLVMDFARRRCAKRTGFLSRNGARTFGGWLQLLVLCCMLLEPLPRSRAVFVPDTSGNPYWLPVPGEAGPFGSPDTGDSDGNGQPDWYDQFQAGLSSGAIAWWGGGNWYIDGQLNNFPAQYHATAYGDRDGDGIPDDIDPYPDDPNNHTIYWPGGGYLIDGVNVNFAPIYAAVGMLPDRDGDGIPDVVDPYPDDANNNNGNSGNGGGTSGGTFSWAGGNFWIDGTLYSFPGGTYSGSSVDSDGDGIPDVLDPYPSDPANNTAWWPGNTVRIDGNLFSAAGQNHRANAGDADADGIPDDLDPYPNDPTNNSYWWTGGWFTIGGSPNFFPPQWLPGNGTDSDGDGIPDAVDPYPNDPSNTGNTSTTSWWPGGTFLVNGQYCWYPGQYYSGLPTDSDGDGIPDVLDPSPNDPWNNTYFTWAGGTYLVDGQWVSFMGGTYGGLWSDRDGDGIPDVADPYPDDVNNNTATWNGGTFLIDGNWTSYGTQYHRANVGDVDNDGIPDDLDPYPNDATNNTFWWDGGTFQIANSSVFFPAQYYAGNGHDSDGDGIPDTLDPYPNDPNNANAGGGDNGNGQTFYWGGGTFTIDSMPTYINGGTFPGSWSDMDNDGIPDVADPYPNDASNNTAWWGGGTFLIQGNWVYLQGQYHRGDAGDADGDGIPDDLDSAPNDPWNGTYFTWPSSPVSYLIDNQQHAFSPTVYGGVYADSDNDGIPDVADPYPNDPNNNNGNGNGGNGGNGGNSQDSDGDGIPDDVEAQWGLNPNNPADAQIVRTDGLTNLEAYQRGLPLNLPALDPNLDSDSDGMTDLYEYRNGLNPSNPADAADAPVGDNVFNLEKARAGIPASTVITDPTQYQQLTGHAMGESYTWNPAVSVAENDWDNDGISNIDELLVFHTDPRDPNSKPSQDQILQALSQNKLSLTTLANLFRLVGCQCGHAGCLGPNCPTGNMGNNCTCQNSGGGGGGGGGGNGGNGGDGNTPPTCRCPQPGCDCNTNGSGQVCEGDVLCHKCMCEVASANAGCACQNDSTCKNDCKACGCPTAGTSDCQCTNITKCNQQPGQCVPKPPCQCVFACGLDTCFCQKTNQDDACTCPCENKCCQCGGDVTQCFKASIEVIASQVGDIGDNIDSINRSIGDKHFVTPKLTENIPDDYVVIRASGVDEKNFSKVFTWDAHADGDGDPGQTAPDDALTYFVSRAAPNHVTVNLKYKQGGAIAATLHVWVVWAVVHRSQTGIADFRPAQGGADFPFYADQLWRFTFDIQPPAILGQNGCTEYPELSEHADKNVPGHDVAYILEPGVPSDSATMKWDVSRQVHATVRNPTGIDRGLLQAGGQTGSLYGNQVKALDEPVVFPTDDDARGNDDPYESQMLDEDDDPYHQKSGYRLGHQVGQLSSFDFPHLGAANTWGGPARIFAVEFDFREFARLELWDGSRKEGRFWYRISDLDGEALWHYYFKVKWDPINNQWIDNGCDTGPGNNQ